MPHLARPRLAPALLALAALATLAHLVYYAPRTVDDMYISLRYAEHLTQGHGLVYNPGERVEGFSNPLWVLLQALGLTLGADGVTFTKGLGLVSMAGLFAACFAYARRALRLTPALAVVPLLLLAANSYVAFWALQGLETPSFLALLVAYAWALHAWFDAPSRRSGLVLGALTLALATTRPEAPLYVLTLALAALLERPQPLARLRQTLPVALPVAAVAAGLLLARRLYYGAWFPHTFAAKPGDGTSLSNLDPLVSQGAGPLEVAFLALGLAFLVALAARRRFVPLALALTNLFFVATAHVDWMPNQRHALPLWVAASLGWGWGVGRLAGLPHRAARVASVAAALVLLAATSVQLARLDARYSIYDHRTHGRGVEWRRPKTIQRLADAWDSLRGVPPQHVAAMRQGRMGMVEDLFDLLEASADPLEDSWYVGRDIGRIGWLAPARVFDTLGLFTPAAAADSTWRQSHRASDALIAVALARRPVALHPYEWAADFGRAGSALAPYLVTQGPRSAPRRLLLRDTAPPTPEQVLARYRRAADRLPSAFLVATLYGESVGGAVLSRLAHLERLLDGARPLTVPAAPPALSGGPARLGPFALHGCEPLTQLADPPTRYELTCYWSVDRPTNEAPDVFVHVHDARGRRVALADHPLTHGLHPPQRWRPRELVRDTVRFDLPATARADALQVYLGLFGPKGRLPVSPPALTDGHHRVPLRPAPAG